MDGQQYSFSNKNLLTGFLDKTLRKYASVPRLGLFFSSYSRTSFNLFQRKYPVPHKNSSTRNDKRFLNIFVYIFLSGDFHYLLLSYTCEPNAHLS